MLTASWVCCIMLSNNFALAEELVAIPTEFKTAGSNFYMPNTPITIYVMQFCSGTESHLGTGSGELKFYMVNMRRRFQFALIRGGLFPFCLILHAQILCTYAKGFEKPVLAAYSEQTVFSNLLEPLHGHLSLTESSTEMM